MNITCLLFGLHCATAAPTIPDIQVMPMYICYDGNGEAVLISTTPVQCSEPPPCPPNDTGLTS